MCRMKRMSNRCCNMKINDSGRIHISILSLWGLSEETGLPGIRSSEKVLFPTSDILSRITTQDLTKVSQEETCAMPFSNLGVRISCSQLSTVKTKVRGSDES